MRKLLQIFKSVFTTAWTPYKTFIAFILSFLTTLFVKDAITPLLFFGKNYGGRGIWIQLGILGAYILILFLIFLLSISILCLLFPKIAIQLRQKLDLWRKMIKADNKARIYLVLLILGFGFGGIYFVNNVLPSIDTMAWKYSAPQTVPAAYPAGIDFRVCLYRTANIKFFGTQAPESVVATTYTSCFPPLVDFLSMPFLLLDENSAYSVQIGLLFLGNIISLLIVAYLAKEYLFSDFGFEGINTALLAVFIFFAMLFYTFSSYPFMFSIERGNFDIYTMVFALAAVLCLFKFPRNVWLPVILLSIATHLKIYPAILFVLLFYKHGKKMILPTLLVNIVFLFILGIQNGLGFLKSLFLLTSSVSNGSDYWVANHSATTFAKIIADKTNLTMPSYFNVLSNSLSRVFILVPIILWCLAAITLFRQKYSERNALLWLMVSIPVMDMIPSTSFDYKSVILSSAVFFLLALLTRNIVKKRSLVDFIQLGAVLVILLFLGRSYVFFDPSQSIISDKYLWSLSLEALMVFNILKNYYSERKIKGLVKI